MRLYLPRTIRIPTGLYNLISSQVICQAAIGVPLPSAKTLLATLSSDFDDEIKCKGCKKCLYSFISTCCYISCASSCKLSIIFTALQSSVIEVPVYYIKFTLQLHKNAIHLRNAKTCNVLQSVKEQ